MPKPLRRKAQPERVKRQAPKPLNRTKYIYDGGRLLVGDCLEILPTLDADSIDSCVTDPPYGLKFMGKEWDHGVPGKPFWEETLRVLKPGAHLLAFGGTRTYHRLACAIEDAGFEIRDCIMWVYGSGFPKSMNVGKAIDKAAGAERRVVGFDRKKALQQTQASGTKAHGVPQEIDITAPSTEEAKQWDGWGTALKPACEPIVVARKPLSEKTVAANVLKWGTGAINVDGCRVETTENLNSGAYAKEGSSRHDGSENWRYKRDGDAGTYAQPTGRWPANLIHDGSEEVVEGFPQTTSGKRNPSSCNKSKTSLSVSIGKFSSDVYDGNTYDDSGSAARFFYCAKASKKERNGSKHPTVKPLALMKYLVSLVTPPDGIALDNFLGSGTTAEAALEGFRFLGIEKYHGLEDTIRRLTSR